jgi:hypothetical protein
MGYDLHITRRQHWSGKGGDIAAEEWLEFVECDPELRLQPQDGRYLAVWSGPSQLEQPWLQWSDGQIETKNPDAALIDKMIAIARRLGARVQGDDGEFYVSGRSSPRPAKKPLRARLPVLPARRRAPRAARPEPAQVPFRAGDRVVDVWGKTATVLEIEAEAEHGLGMIRARYDDGRELEYSALAHPFAPIESEHRTKGES